MPWLKVSDHAAFHPTALATIEHDDADDRTMNEVFGFVARCAVASAAHELDYVVPLGVAKHIAGMSRAAALIEQAVAAGFMVRTTSGDGAAGLKLVQDPELFHMILADERAWNNQRRNDARNPELIVPVRLRDGDSCRWCGKVVSWTDRKSGRAGTYDHLHPGQQATVETFVVACKSCNSERQTNPDWAPRLRRAPVKPFYSAETVAMLSKHGHEVATAVAANRETTARERGREHEGTGNGSTSGPAPHDREPAHGPQVAAQHTEGGTGNGSTSGPVPAEVEVPERDHERGWTGNGSTSGPAAPARKTVHAPERPWWDPIEGEGVHGNGSTSGPAPHDRESAPAVPGDGANYPAPEGPGGGADPVVDPVPADSGRSGRFLQIPTSPEYRGSSGIGGSPARQVRQIGGVSDLDMPGRVGTGQAGPGWAGPGRAGQGPDRAGAAGPQGDPVCEVRPGYPVESRSSRARPRRRTWEN